MVEIQHRYTRNVLFRVDADILSWSDLRGARLRGANLCSMDLSWADFREANLYGANIYGARLRGAIGNGREICSMQCDQWPVVVAGGEMAIGCQQHPLSDWWQFTDAEIAAMAGGALDWWLRWKPILKQIFGEGGAVVQEADAVVQEVSE